MSAVRRLGWGMAWLGLLSACGQKIPLPPRGEGLVLTDSSFVRVQVVTFPGETLIDLAFGDGLYVLTRDTLYKLRLDGAFTSAVFGGIQQGIALAQRRSDGKVFVLDGGVPGILAYPSDGSPVPETVVVDSTWRAPRGLAVTEEALFVADSAADRVFRYRWDSAGGVVKDTFLNPGEGFLNARGPLGMHLDYQNTLWVTSGTKHWVNRVAPTSPPALLGHLGDSLGEGGSEAGRLRIPRDVAADLFGRVVVADYGNRRLQIFSATEGQVLQTFASPDSLPPFSVAFSADGGKIWAGYPEQLERYETPKIPDFPDDEDPGFEEP